MRADTIMAKGGHLSGMDTAMRLAASAYYTILLDTGADAVKKKRKTARR